MQFPTNAIRLDPELLVSTALAPCKMPVYAAITMQTVKTVLLLKLSMKEVTAADSAGRDFFFGFRNFRNFRKFGRWEVYPLTRMRCPVNGAAYKVISVLFKGTTIEFHKYFTVPSKNICDLVIPSFQMVAISTGRLRWRPCLMKQ
jgi:hypothetical protein